jgi:dolichol-phosphate mannosyltransferase
MGEFAKERVALSNLGKRLALFVAKADVSDPMSGFFVVRRSYLNEVVHSLSNIGFKILLDLVASSRRPVRFGEVAYTFRNRLRGESKLDILVGLEYLELLVDKLIGDWIPVRYVIFGGVGALGVVLNLVLLYVLNVITQSDHQTAQVAAAAIVIAPNFLLNNQLTFRAYRLKGLRLLWGMVLFYLACGIGLWTNVKVAEALRESGVWWYAAGLVGIVIGSVWNYWVSSVMVWRVNRRR